MFNDFQLKDFEVLDIIDDYIFVINKYSIVNHLIDEDLRQEIIIKIYIKLTKKRKK